MALAGSLPAARMTSWKRHCRLTPTPLCRSPTPQARQGSSTGARGLAAPAGLAGCSDKGKVPWLAPERRWHGGAGTPHWPVCRTALGGRQRQACGKRQAQGARQPVELMTSDIHVDDFSFFVVVRSSIQDGSGCCRRLQGSHPDSLWVQGPQSPGERILRSPGRG